MTIIIGLGNPGQKYKKTRHNLGFRVVDEFAKENNFPEFKFVKKYKALISKKDELILVKPQTFMNESGKATRTVLGVTPRTVLVVVHDDIDLPLGKFKISRNRGSAGHKGVQSIIKELSSKDFTRLRVGIRPARYRGLVRSTEKFVLQKFNKDEEKIIKEVVKKTVETLELFLTQGLKNNE